MMSGRVSIWRRVQAVLSVLFFFCKPRTGVDFRNNDASLQVLHATACVCPNIGIDAPSTLPWEASPPPRAKVDRSASESFEGGRIFFLPVSW